MMNLKKLDVLSLQTSYMKNDPTTIAMCAAINPQFKKLADEVKNCLIYARIDDLEEAVLDELAWQMDIDWYDANADIDVKQKLIKTAPEIHKTRGTPDAVERIVKTYFSDGYVKEWFEYGGNPYMFKVVTSNPSVTSELAEQFTKVLDSVKNKRSHLESILISLAGEMNLYFSGVVHIGDNIIIRQVV